MNQLSLQKFCSLATLARQNRNNTAFNNHVPDMEQWTQVYIPYFPYKREVIFFCSLATLARQNRNNTAFNNHVPDMEQWTQVLCTIFSL